MRHGLILSRYKVFLSNYIVTTEQSQAIPISELTGQQ